MKDLHELAEDVEWEASEDVVESKVLYEMGDQVIEGLFKLKEAAISLEKAAKGEPRKLIRRRRSQEPR